MASVGRNQPCPCGSGRRYKECHGAIDGTGASRLAEASVPSWVPQTMAAALRAQKCGHSFEAMRLYRQVLDIDPANFDATHMLGLVEFELGHHAQALTLIKRAIELRPELGTPRHNLRLLESLPLVETEICREVLPRLASRMNLAFELADLAAAASLDIVVGDACDAPERAALDCILAACGTAPRTIWSETSDAPLPGTPASRITTDDFPRGAALIILGVQRSLASWVSSLRAAQVLVVATRPEPCAIIDRVDELAAAGCDRPALLCATPELAERLGFPRTASLPRRETATIDS